MTNAKSHLSSIPFVAILQLYNINTNNNFNGFAEVHDKSSTYGIQIETDNFIISYTDVLGFKVVCANLSVIPHDTKLNIKYE
jgi:hypothetical protein